MPVKYLIEELITFNTSNTQSIYEALNVCDNWFTISVTANDYYSNSIVNSFVKEIDITGFNISDYDDPVDVSSIYFDNSQIIL